MWSSTGAAVGVVTKLVYMHASLCRRVIALDFIVDGGGRVLVGLLEGDGAFHLAAAADDRNYIAPSVGLGENVALRSVVRVE